MSKIEDVSIDIDLLFASKKRFHPDESTFETTQNSQHHPSSATPELQLQLAKKSLSGEHAVHTKGLLRQNLLAQYMEQVGEHEIANQAVLSMLKSMIKTI